MLELGRDDPMFERLGLAHALNMHMAQGIMVDCGTAVMSSIKRHLSNQRLFNVTLTRVREALEVYIDKRAKLARAFDHNRGKETSALEKIGHRGRPAAWRRGR